MNRERLASIIIDNYNYGRFLGAAIDSALAQTYPSVEVIVVDDGSTDHSREVIASYGSRITPVLKFNGGQASAFNAGFAASRGEGIVFLDADDLLLPSALAEAMPWLDDQNTVKVQWPMCLTGAGGTEDRGLFPDGTMPDGDLREIVRRIGPTNHLCAPTSGNVWSRRLLEQIFPVPEPLYRTDCDTYLFECAPFFGTLKTLSKPLSIYRQHGTNGRPSVGVDVRVKRELAYYEQYSGFLAAYCASQGYTIDQAEWRRHCWWYQHQQLIQHVAALSSQDRPFILVDDGSLEPGRIAGRQPIPFSECDGQYAGAPADDAAAIAELRRVQKRFAASHIVFAWPSFWWLEHYAGFHQHLRGTARLCVSDDCAVIFELMPESTL